MISKTQLASNMGSKTIEWLIEYRRLAFSLVALFIAVGLLALFTMARQEDPSFPYRAGLIKIFYPGATPTQIEKLITEPFEEQLTQISEVNDVTSTSRDDLAIFRVELFDSVYDTDAAWERVLRGIDRAKLEFPVGVVKIEFDDRQIDMPTAVISITGSDDAILLESAALRLKKYLIRLPGISRVEVNGGPQKELIVKLDQESINRLGIPRQYIANTLLQRNRIIPGGVVTNAGKNIRLNTQSDFDSIDELRRTNIKLPSGQIVPLSTIAQVSLEPKLPLTSQVYQDGRRAVSLGVIAERGQVDAVKLGEQLRTKIEQVRADFAPLRIEESFFQPDYVSDRLNGLRNSLYLSISVIALVVFLAMGWRTGLLVSLVLPIVTLISLGLYSVGGGVFHQMAVIGIVISLGILIDNAIVVVEFIETSLRNGVDKSVAMRDAIKVMAKPLMASTGTTIAAFMPLLLAKGGVGDFTRAIPTMIVIALQVSYVVSVFVLPLVAFYWLKPKAPSSKQSWAVTMTQRLATYCADMVEFQPKLVLLITSVLMAVSLAMAPTLKQEFFPSTDRSQIVVDMQLPTNTPLIQTAKISKEIEATLLAHEGVKSVYRSVGEAGFQFYYNMLGADNEARMARFTVNTQSDEDNVKLVNWVRETLMPKYPSVTFIPSLLGQGPPRPAPIEIRIKHPDLQTLFTASQTIKSVLSGIQGVRELRSNLDLGTPEIAMAIQSNAALSLGLEPAEIASAVYAESRGLNAGQFLYDDDPIPIRVRSSKGQNTSIDVIRNQYVYSSDTQATPLNQMASLTPRWQPTSLRHHNYERTVTVLAQVGEGFAFNQVLADFSVALEGIDLDDSITIEFGGDAAASSEANGNIATGAPLALGMLIFFMMFQFNSFRRISIVFFSIPLAAVGVIPGLALSGQPFGFQSLLGVIALVGIVVNNAIVLIDVVDRSLAQGQSIKQAVRIALEQRTAPIILTTATTILGLMPLAFSSSTLWPPMAWAIISGLTLSTVLTLVAIPALCVTFLGKKQDMLPSIEFNKNLVSVLFLIACVGFLVQPISSFAADEAAPTNTAASINEEASTNEAASDQAQATLLNIQLSDIFKLIESNKQVTAAQHDVNAAKFNHQKTKRQAWAPKLRLAGEYSQRDDDSVIGLPEPIGNLSVTDSVAYVYEVKLTQPLMNPSLWRYQTALAYQTKSASASAQSTKHIKTGQALTQYLSVLTINEERKAQNALLQSLQVRRKRIANELALGQALKTDLLQIEFEINKLRQGLVVNENQAIVNKDKLSKLLSLPIASQLSLTPIGDLFSSLEVNDQLIDDQLGCLERKDCDALKQQLIALKNQKASIKAGVLPNINLSVADRRSDGQLFVSEKDQRLMLEFSWDIFSGGVRSSQARSIQANRDALEQRLIALQQQIRVDISRAKASWKNSTSSLELAKESVVLSQERVRLSRRRYDNGLLNLDLLLDAEAALSSANASLASAKVNLVKAWVQYQMATGANYQQLNINLTKT